MAAGAESHGAGLAQPRLPRALGHQQPHQPDHPEPLDLRALGVPFPHLLPVSVVGNQDLQEQSLDAFEVGYSGTSSTAVLIVVGGALQELGRERHPLHRGRVRPLHGAQPAIELAAQPARDRRPRTRRGACCPAASRIATSARARTKGSSSASTARSISTSARLRELLVSKRSRSEGLSALGAQPAAEQPFQRRCEMRRDGRCLGALSVAYADDARSGRTC